jgi:protein-L-isoaspartate(D-aspartate) O-methyltransferase
MMDVPRRARRRPPASAGGASGSAVEVPFRLQATGYRLQVRTTEAPPAFRRERKGLAAPFALLAVFLAGCPDRPTPVAAPPPQKDAAPRKDGPGLADGFESQRAEMVKALSAVVKDPRVLDALSRVPRHEFVPPGQRSRSYVNTPLPIAENQTISAPEIVAIMTEALDLKGDEKVLEIGTGSGYQAAVLGELVAEVYTVEIRSTLAVAARKTLGSLKERGVLHYRRIEVIAGDGYDGYKGSAPYDRIIVTAAPRKVPTELINQLKPGGRMVIPVGDFSQELQLITKAADGTHFSQDILPVRFVPMVRPDEAR